MEAFASTEARSVESVTGCYVGWRYWRVRDGKVHSLINDEVWEPRMAVVAENKDKHFWRALLAICAGALLFVAINAFFLESTYSLALSIFGFFLLAIEASLVFRLGMWREDWTKAFKSGVYAYERFPKALEEAEFISAAITKRWKRHRHHSTLILGQVALWGTVLEYTEGARGQYAYPVSFDYMLSKDGELEPIPAHLKARLEATYEPTHPA